MSSEIKHPTLSEKIACAIAVVLDPDRHGTKDVGQLISVYEQLAAQGISLTSVTEHAQTNLGEYHESVR